LAWLAGIFGGAAFYVMQSLLAAALWYFLYIISRRILKNAWMAAMPPLAVGFSPALFVLAQDGAAMLCAVFAAALCLCVQSGFRKKHRTLGFLLIFAITCAGFLTNYAFAVYALAASAVFAAYYAARRRYRDIGGVPVAAGAGILAGFIVFPACVEYLSRPGDGASYAEKLSVLYSAASNTGFGGFLHIFALIMLLSGLAILYFRYKSSKDSDPAAPSDPAAAAYRRRETRRAAKSRAPRPAWQSEVVFILLALAANVLYALAEAAAMRNADPAAVYFALPVFAALCASAVLRAVPALGGTRNAAAIIGGGVWIGMALVGWGTR
jgi:hypothetical protein